MGDHGKGERAHDPTVAVGKSMAGFVGCDETIERLYFYLDGELTEERREEIARHLDLCGPCVDVYGFEAELRKVISNRCKDHVPASLIDRVADALRRGARPPPRLTPVFPFFLPTLSRLGSLHRPPSLACSSSVRRARPHVTPSGPYTGLRERICTAPPGDGAVAWATAERMASWVGAAPRTCRLPTGRDLLEADFEELTAKAEELVAESTGLRSASGPARARVTDRAGWVRRKCRIVPAFDRTPPREARPRPLHGHQPVDRAFGGTTGERRAERSPVRRWGWSSVGSRPGCSASTTSYSPKSRSRTKTSSTSSARTSSRSSSSTASSPREFRLWLALHEVTHRCQFTAIPWMRDYFVSLVEEGIGSLEPDPARLAEALRRMTDEILAGRNPLRENGALGLVATPEQLEGLQRIQALMSLLEGHGDVTMDRAGADRHPERRPLREVLRRRRKQAKGPARLLQQLIGIEAKLRQYEEGERFIEAVEDSGGPELLDRAWRGPGVAALA